MTKRPKPFAAVATWVGLFAFISILPMTRMLTGYVGPSAGAPRSFAGTEVGVLCFVLVLVVSLVQLRAIAIWLTVALLGLSAVAGLLRIPTLVTSSSSPLILVSTVLGLALNTISAWYLSRPAFHSVAAKVRAERDQEALRRHAERQVRRAAGI